MTPPFEYVLAPRTVSLGFSTAPGLNAVESLRLLASDEQMSGFGEWVVRTKALLTPEEKERHDLVYGVLYFVLFAALKNHRLVDTPMPQLIARLRQIDPHLLRDQAMDHIVELQTLYPESWPRPAVTAADLMNDSTLLIDYVSQVWNCSSADMGPVVAYMHDPEAMKTLIVDHSQAMWDRWLEPEWLRIRPMLEESIAAFQSMQYADHEMTGYEAVRAVTGRDMRGAFEEKMKAADRLVFVAGAHLGPYISMFKDDATVYILFTARAPRGAKVAPSSDLSRAELLVRLNALADDTRLKILELLTQHEELCAQDFIEILDLSQSTVSRHLSQLSASGYVIERRRDVAKCYTLNTDRVMDTLRALTSFLSRA